MTAGEFYESMDWLFRRQKHIERTLAAKHIEDGSLVLCDMTSVYFEGAKCPLAKRGYSRGVTSPGRLYLQPAAADKTCSGRSADRESSYP